MTKNILIWALLFLFCCSKGYAQKGEYQISIQSGYENFPRFFNDGYNFALNFKHYVNNRMYAVANFHTGLANMRREGQILSNSQKHYNLDNKLRDYMLGFGIGGDISRKNRHIVYAQATAGLGTRDRKRETIGEDGNEVSYTSNRTTFALSFSAGYDYLLTDWFTIGINYTGYQIGRYKNTCNLKLGVNF